MITLDSINKLQLGQFFGSNKDKNQEIMKCYLNLIDYKGVAFNEAIRMFLARFRLPGEAD